MYPWHPLALAQERSQKVLIRGFLNILLGPWQTMFVERKVRYSALFTILVGWHAGAVSFLPSDVILARLACPPWVTSCFDYILEELTYLSTNIDGNATLAYFASGQWRRKKCFITLTPSCQILLKKNLRCWISWSVCRWQEFNICDVTFY